MITRPVQGPLHRLSRLRQGRRPQQLHQPPQQQLLLLRLRQRPRPPQLFFRVRFGRLAFAQRQITPTASWPHRGALNAESPKRTFSKIQKGELDTK